MTVSNVSTAVAISAIFTEGAERTVRAARRLEGLGVWPLRTSLVKFSDAWVEVYDAAHKPSRVQFDSLDIVPVKIPAGQTVHPFSETP